MSDADRPRVPGEQFEEDVVAAWHAAYLKAEANDAMESDFDAFISLSWNGYPMLHAQLETSHARLEAARRERDEARDSAWYRFGCLAWTWLADHWEGEDGWELGGLAVEAGLAERIAYDPEKHGECEAEPGDEIIYPLKGDPKNINPRAEQAEAENVRLRAALAEWRRVDEHQLSGCKRCAAGLCSTFDELWSAWETTVRAALSTSREPSPPETAK